MTQIALPFETRRTAAAQPAAPARQGAPAGAAASAFDESGFRIGLDHARYGLTPPADHLHPAHPVREGWLRGRTLFAGRVLPARREARQWLALRLDAWLRGRPFDELTVTPRLLARIDVMRCPVTREVLSRGDAGMDDAVVIAVCEAEGYAAGNLAVVSRRAAMARHWMADDGPYPLQPAQRQRLLSLLSLGTPLPHAQAAAVPLAVLPPLRLRLRNPVQALQVLLTQVFAGPGWARRMAELGALMPAAARRPYALYMSALLARSLDVPADADADERAAAMEDAGPHPSVCARWQALAAQIGPAEAQRIVRTAAQRGLWPRPCRWVEEEADAAPAAGDTESLTR